MAPLQLTTGERFRAIRYAILGIVVPIVIATATQFSTHRTPFFIGGALVILASIIVIMVPRRHRALVWIGAYGCLPALTAMQAYSGGAGSGYSVLMMMAMIWFGLQATDRELIVGLALLAECAYLPMLLIGPPAYPVGWGHATLLVVVGLTVAITLRALARETQQLTQRLRHEAVIDDLTGLLNRRGWRHAAPRELMRANRTGRPVALLMLDLDQFKALNDELGHQEGDRLLREAAEQMRAAFRAGDIVARLGGDEFVVLMTNATLDGATSAIARLREVMPAEAIFSAGVAIWDRKEGLEEFLRRCDKALYGAKEAGDGRTVISAAGALEAVPDPPYPLMVATDAA
jgi:diguanylate cyclase (GGDEF)-like protein